MLVSWILLSWATAVFGQTQLLTVSDARGNATSPIHYGALYEVRCHASEIYSCRILC